MTELSEKVSFTLERELGAEGADVPDEVQLLPSGEVRPKGKTAFIVDEDARRSIAEAFGRCSTDLVIDYEHQSLSGSEAPAAGWIKGIEDRGEDGIWCRVQWTDRAKEYLLAREYRYISPVVLIRKKDGRAVELLGAGLTNLPAIDGMTPVVNSAREVAADAGMAAYKEMYLGVLKIIGLPEDARAKDIEETVATLSSREGLVPESELVALKEELRAVEADSLIREAMGEGKLAPALAGWAREYAREDLEGFREFLAGACKMVPLNSMRETARQQVASGPQRDINLLLGVSDESFDRYARAAAE
ncbi:MAG TPA: phage protease [Nitrospirota bacterium]